MPLTTGADCDVPDIMKIVLLSEANSGCALGITWLPPSMVL